MLLKTDDLVLNTHHYKGFVLAINLGTANDINEFISDEVDELESGNKSLETDIYYEIHLSKNDIRDIAIAADIEGVK